MKKIFLPLLLMFSLSGCEFLPSSSISNSNSQQEEQEDEFLSFEEINLKNKVESLELTLNDQKYSIDFSYDAKELFNLVKTNGTLPSAKVIDLSYNSDESGKNHNKFFHYDFNKSSDFYYLINQDNNNIKKIDYFRNRISVEFFQIDTPLHGVYYDPDGEMLLLKENSSTQIPVDHPNFEEYKLIDNTYRIFKQFTFFNDSIYNDYESHYTYSFELYDNYLKVSCTNPFGYKINAPKDVQEIICLKSLSKEYSTTEEFYLNIKTGEIDKYSYVGKGLFNPIVSNTYIDVNLTINKSSLIESKIEEKIDAEIKNIKELCIYDYKKK